MSLLPYYWHLHLQELHEHYDLPAASAAFPKAARTEPTTRTEAAESESPGSFRMPPSVHRDDHASASASSSIDASTLAVLRATNNNVKRISDMATILWGYAESVDIVGAVAAEKIAAVSLSYGKEVFQPRAAVPRRAVLRTLAVDYLSTGRAVPGVPFISNACIEAVLGRTENVQRLASFLLQFIPWDANTFIFDVCSIILHPAYTAAAYWGSETAR